MADGDCIAQLAGWVGYRVEGWRHAHRGARRWLVLELTPVPGHVLHCSGCGDAVAAIHDRTVRRIRDLPVFEDPVELEVERLRLACPRCGPRLEQLDWLDRLARVTRRLADSVARLCAATSVQHAANWHGIDWKTARAIDFRALQRRVGPENLDGVRRIAMDEFAIQKGHRYATVVVDVERKRVLWVGRGRSRAEVRPFFETLGPEGCARIQAVAMDMNTAFDLEVRRHCKQARIIYDLFHVVAKYGREVIGRVRVDAANQLRHDQPARRVVKQAHWLLLRNPANLKTPAQHVRLHEVLAANQSLMTVYVMKEQMKALWTAPTAWVWRQTWTQWMAYAKQSQIPALMQFARRLKGYWRGIVSRVRWPMHTGQLEGINNKIKVIKRMAYGYRDSEYFFLKIKAAFPGNP